MRSNNHRLSKPVAKRKNSTMQQNRDSRNVHRMSKREYEEEMMRRSRRPKGSRAKKQVNKRKRWLREQILKLVLIAFLILGIRHLFDSMSWITTAVPMMKNQNSVVVDVNGNVIDEIGKERLKEHVAYSDIPKYMVDAYVDIEDERFFSHSGVDIKRTGAAIITYITHGGKSSFGGSTITQQLVKNITGNDDNSVSRKVNEWIKAAELESFTSKEEILEAYFNIIYTAPNTYGVGMGAKYYFNKNVKDLSLAECAYIAGINISPNSYNPFGEQDNSEKIKKRTKIVLDKMKQKNHITDEEYNLAIEELNNGLAFEKGDIETESDGVYSYYTDSVIAEVVSDISQKKHISEKFATNYIYMAGLTIHSTEDPKVQEEIDKVYNNRNYGLISSSGQKSQSAMVVIDHSTGQVKGIAGGLGEKTVSRGLNRATQSKRQTGSAIKPVAVLAPGIDKKLFTASTIYEDAPTTFNGDYSPKDNDAYIGNITVRRAVESSQNIPFVKMMEQITPEEAIKYMKKMGISSLTEKDNALPLALGGEDRGITPLEMAGAYATIANDGVYIEPTFYTYISDSRGKKVFKSKQKKTKVFSKEVAYIIKDLLRQPVEGTNGTARNCKIDGTDVAAKTGTTNENYDKWLCGFTNYYTAVTWYGYDQNESISYGGKSPASQLWSTVMKNIHSNLPKTRFTKPASVKQAEVCSKTGLLANSKCQDTHTEYYLPGTLPDKCVECTGSGGKIVYNEPKKQEQEQQEKQEEVNQEKNNKPSEEIQTNNNDVEVTNVPNNNSSGNNSNSSNSSENKVENNANNNDSNNTIDNQNNNGNNSTSSSSNNSNQSTNENNSLNNNQGGLVDDGQGDTGP